MTIELRQSRSQRLAGAILRDREQRAGRRSTSATKSRPLGSDFDPFASTRWRVVAHGDGWPRKRADRGPGYLPKTPMRMGPVGWFIGCHHCWHEFESKGWAYCPTCMELPAEERRGAPPTAWRSCQVPGCDGRISPQRRSDARYCEAHSAGRNASKLPTPPTGQKYEDTREIHQQNQLGFSALIAPSDFPINIIGGYRFPLAKKLTESPPLIPEVLSEDMLLRKRVDA